MPSITCPVRASRCPRGERADDGQAWLRDKLRREGVSAEGLLPTPLRLRKEVERLTDTVQDLRSEQDVREVVKGLNQRILAWRRIPEGPPVYLPLVDEETMVASWRDAQPRPSSPAQVGTPARDVPVPRAPDGGIASAAGERVRHPSHSESRHNALKVVIRR